MYVYVGAVAPEKVGLTIDNAALAADPLDLSDVTAVTLEVRTPTQTLTWATTITDQSETELVVEHEFEAGDLGAAGTYRIVAIMDVPGGTRRAGPTALEVREL